MADDAPKKKRPKKATRGARGKGTVFYSEARRLWVGRAILTRSAGGKGTRYVERTGRTQREVLDKLRDASPPGLDETVAGWASRWLSGLGCRPSTHDSYASNVERHVVPALGHLKLVAVTPYHVEHAARTWARSVAPATVRLILAQLSACLSAAVRAEIIPRNPVSVALKARVPRRDVAPLTPDELRAVITAAGGPAARVVAFLAATGARVGEAIALDVTDWDAGARTVSITKTQPKARGRPPGPPKSPHSLRMIRVPDAAVPAVRAAAGDRTAGPLFPTASGARTDNTLVRRAWLRLLKQLGLPARKPHALRHSVITALVSAGTPLGDVAKYVGDRVQTIVANYLHAAGTDPAAKLDALLGGGKVVAGEVRRRKSKKS